MYYKVVTSYENKLVSAYVYGTIFQQEYKVGEFVFSEDNLPLMVFNCLERARVFCMSWGDPVYQCEVVNPRKDTNTFIPDIRSILMSYSTTHTKKFFLKKANYYSSKKYITGTVFCDGVSLTKRVW